MNGHATARLCPICGQACLSILPQPAQDYLSGQTFYLARCSACHCGQTQWPDDIPHAPGAYYGAQYYGSEQGKFSPWLEKLFAWNHRRNALRLLRRFGSHHVLEIGCGRAYILRQLQDLGCEVHGLESADAPPWILHHPQVPIRTLSADESTWPYESNQFDLLLLWHVLEHLPHPHQVMQQAQRVLAPGGILVICVPNWASWQAQWGGKHWFHLDLPRHEFHYTAEGLTHLLESHGFKLLNTEAGDVLQNGYGWVQTIANRILPGDMNLLYRFFQGGPPWHSVHHKSWIALQLLSAPLWGGIALGAYLAESAAGQHATLTYYAVKQ